METKNLAELIATALGVDPNNVVLFDENDDAISIAQAVGDLPKTTHNYTLSFQ